MRNVETASTIIRHSFTEPKHVALVEWLTDYGIGAQLFGQVPRDEVEDYIDGHGWRNPDREIRLAIHEMPDWGWWEPRHDQPWRREQARGRELDALLGKGE